MAGPEREPHEKKIAINFTHHGALSSTRQLATVTAEPGANVAPASCGTMRVSRNVAVR